MSAGGLPAGGGFLVEAADPDRAATPERLPPEARDIREAVGEFVAREVAPRREAVEAGDHAAHRDLLARLGAAGFLGVEVPERYGGAGLGAAASAVVADALGPSGAFATTVAAHAGIGTWPLLFFGDDAQRERWLPGLAAGTTVAAYALTEPGAGSDARGLRTRAARRPDGGFRLDGAKQFITNAGFADLFTLYARVGDEGLAAFLVPARSPGLAVGPEERKMGMKGTSTCPLALDGVPLGPEALLGRVGEGHRIAFNVLNVGRFALAAGTVGVMREALATATAYSGERVAFGRPIGGFPLVAAKLAGMAARLYETEALVHRLAGMIDARLAAAGGDSSEAVRAALEEHAIECSVAKVLGSEDLAWVVDEQVQVHGGYGFIEDYPAARPYRDARIQRIWEGTNEINRLLVPGTILRRAAQGRLDLSPPAGAGEAPGGPWAPERRRLERLRALARDLTLAAADRFGDRLDEEQEVLAGLADIAISLVAAESALVRARVADPGAGEGPHADLARMVLSQRAAAARAAAVAIAPRIGGAAGAGALLDRVRDAFDGPPEDPIALVRAVAARVREAGGTPV